MAGRGASPEVRRAAAERRNQVLQLRLRGLTFEEIGTRLGISRHLAYKHYRKAIGLIPPANVEHLRILQGERITDAYRRIYMEAAGRPDPKFPNDPTKTIRPTARQVFRFVDILLKIMRHEMLLNALDPPRPAQGVSARVDHSVSDKELDRQLARLTNAERGEFMRLNRKMQGRGVDLGPEYDYEVEARAAAAAEWCAANPEKAPELEIRIVEFKPGRVRWEQSEVVSHLTRDEQSQLRGLILKARARRDAGGRQEESDKRQEVPTAPATSNSKGHTPSPIAVAPANPSENRQPCPKCGQYPTNDEEPMWNGDVPIWHQNCRRIG